MIFNKTYKAKCVCVCACIGVCVGLRESTLCLDKATHADRIRSTSDLEKKTCGVQVLFPEWALVVLVHVYRGVRQPSRRHGFKKFQSLLPSKYCSSCLVSV